LNVYNQQVNNLPKLNRSDYENHLDYSIKWSDALKSRLLQGTEFHFSEKHILPLMYRPYLKVFYYAEKGLSDRLTSNHYEMFGNNLSKSNLVIAVDRSRVFNVLVSDKPIDLHFNGDSRCFPLYRYTTDGSRVENITAWALGQFQKQYKDKTITKENIFYYVYAVLHHPAYRSKYEQNLKREFPRIPFYESFWQWAGWGQRLVELHLNYEKIEPYPLERLNVGPHRGLDTTKSTSTRPPSGDEVRPTCRLMARKETGVIEVDTVTTLRGVPSAAWEYRLGTYSALEWVLERYKEKKPKDPTIAEKFNTYRFAEYKEAVIALLGRVCAVSVKTMEIVKEMTE
jgi:predicted helicase